MVSSSSPQRLGQSAPHQRLVRLLPIARTGLRHKKVGMVVHERCEACAELEAREAATLSHNPDYARQSDFPRPRPRYAT